MKLESYEITRQADKDIEEIFRYTLKEYGKKQAVKYLSALKSLFIKLCKTPEIGRLRDELREGLRSITNDQHIIFYSINENKILIVRVLHGNRDLPKHWP